MGVEVVQQDAADEPADDGPLRTCAATRTRRPVEELLRFVVSPDGVLTPDLACRLPGRGVWVSARHSTVAAAVRSRAFARSLKANVTVPDDLPDLVDRLLLRRVADALSLANKAGLVLAGSTKVEAAIESGSPVALIHASDGSDDGVERLDRRFRAMSRDLGRPATIERGLTNEQLSLALGRSNVVHAALKSGGAAKRFIVEAERLRLYRTAESETDASMPADVAAPESLSDTGKV